MSALRDRKFVEVATLKSLIKPMSKTLIVAHPDDEIIFFGADNYDRIIVVFGDFGDSRGSTGGDARRQALKELPYADKIVHLDLPESHWTWDRGEEGQRNYVDSETSNNRRKAYYKNYHDLCEFLKGLEADEVTTHESWGEYNNLDHVLVHHACMDTLHCPVNGLDPETYRKAKQIYKDNNVWTWYF